MARLEKDKPSTRAQARTEASSRPYRPYNRSDHRASWLVGACSSPIYRGSLRPGAVGVACSVCAACHRPCLRPGAVGVAQDNLPFHPFWLLPGFFKELNTDFTPALLHYDCNLFNRVVTVSNAKVSNGSFT
jgi:hypothetical protein